MIAMMSCLAAFAVLTAPIEAAPAAKREDIPREAARRMTRGAAAFEAAKTPEELLDAVKEFELASQAAPKWPDPVFNMAQALEKAGDPAGAKKAYEKYLELAPEAADASAVQQKIDKLEYLAEKKQKEKEKVVVDGDWMYEGSSMQVKVKLTGDQLTVMTYPPHLPEGELRLKGTLTGRSFEGKTYFSDGSSHLSRGTISDDNRTIKVTMSVESMDSSARSFFDKDGDGWTEDSPLVRRD